MSAPERLENRLYEAFVEARKAQRCKWPEPQTSKLHEVVWRAALRILATRDSRLLYSYGKQVAAGRVAAEVLLNIDGFNGRSRFSTWLYRMARNELYDIVREVKSQAEVPLEGLPDLPSKAHGGLKMRLPSGVLTADEERLVRLRLEEGYNFRELALIFDISLGGAHNLWRQALQKLKSRLTN